MNSSGYFYSVDALLAVLLVFGVLLVSSPSFEGFKPQLHVHEDLLRVLSDIKISEINNSYVSLLVQNGTIEDTDLSVLEQVGKFYALSMPEAEYLLRNVFDSLELDGNIAVYFSDNLVANSSSIDFEDASYVRTSRQILSGVAGGHNASSGYSVRSFLFSPRKVEYFYFGGYVGDGNITFNLGQNVSSLSVEGDFLEDFEVYVNSEHVADYSPTPGVPFSFEVAGSEGVFSDSSNNISFRSSDQLSVAGGHVRVVYGGFVHEENVRQIPGIKGFINLYDGFYVPGNLSSIDFFLKYNSTYDIFVSVANKTIYEGNSSGLIEEVNITNSTLSSYLDYSHIQQKTVPLRIGISNVTDIYADNRDSDVYSVTDISGSMGSSCFDPSAFCCWFNDCDVESVCTGTCSGTYEDKMSKAKEANYAFIDIVLNYSGNEVGLVGYESDVEAVDTHSLSNDSSSLEGVVDSWIADGGTCICCGINEAASRIVDEGNSTNSQSVVVMSDGMANELCSEQDTGSADTDAVAAACEAYEDHGIKVYAVGFGSDADQETMQDIASCGRGDYYYGDIEELVEIYEKIAQDILSASYEEQRIVGNGSVMTLYPESKISFDYSREESYGMSIVGESALFSNNVSFGNFTIPSNSTVREAKIVSYSGSSWTDRAYFYDNISDSWEVFFNLSEYGSDFTKLGDPYYVNIPLSFIEEGMNKVRISTAFDPGNQSGGSDFNKVIYAVEKRISGYSPVLPVANGCNWHIEFEDFSNETMAFPENYSGDDDCYYASDDYFFSGDNVLLANPNDAISVSLLDLFEILDLNSNHRIETKFSSDEMALSSFSVEGLPFTWDTEVQVRSWK